MSNDDRRIDELLAACLAKVDQIRAQVADLPLGTDESQSQSQVLRNCMEVIEHLIETWQFDRTNR